MYKKRKFNPAIHIVLGFLGVILIGTFLLSLPISNTSGQWFNVVDSFLTSTSAVCVTGLTVVDVAMQFTLFGQIILLLLIQIGGLGFVTLTTLVFLILGKKITFESRLTIKESLNQDGVQGVVKFVKRTIIFIFIVEFIGFICLLPSFISLYGWGPGIFKSLFISVSAFCNAGFDNLGLGAVAFEGLSAFAQNALVLLPIMLLIIIGGIGFLVLFDLPNLFKGKKLNFHTKVVLCVTCILIFGGAILFAVFEWNNINTIGQMSVWQKILNSLFFSISPRTAGFSTVNISNLTPASLVLTQVLMFIGGSPASTAGGIKTTTIFVLLIVLIKNANAKGDVVFRNKRITQRAISKVLKLLSLMISFVVISTLLICAIESLSIDIVLFEVISAMATVGLSLGLTPILGVASKLILCVLMFAGRVGALTITLAISGNDGGLEQEIEYPDAKLVVG